jgi:hypothetical protein
MKPLDETMIEKVARAICRAHCPPTMLPASVDEMADLMWPEWQREAKAAIEAIREEDVSPYER